MNPGSSSRVLRWYRIATFRTKPVVQPTRIGFELELYNTSHNDSNVQLVFLYRLGSGGIGAPRRQFRVQDFIHSEKSFG